MDRITIYDTDEYGERSTLGWFDLDAADLVEVEGQRWDGNNHRGALSGLQLSRAELYRTKGGRWVEHTDARNEFNGPNTWRFLTEDEARTWLMKCGADDAEDILASWFPDTPDEEGPKPQGGRPAIGPTINVAYPRELLDKIEAAADKAGMSRAAWLRQIAEAATR